MQLRRRLVWRTVGRGELQGRTSSRTEIPLRHKFSSTGPDSLVDGFLETKRARDERE